MLIGPLNAFPWVVNGLIEGLLFLFSCQSVKEYIFFLASISLKRVNQFLQAPDLKPLKAIEDIPKRDVVVKFSQASFAWKEDLILLQNLTTKISKGEFIMVVGTVGSGKTSFLSAILGNRYKKPKIKVMVAFS